VYAFGALLILCLAYAYLESRAFGHEVAIPMYGYLLAALAALANILISRFSPDLLPHNLRLLGNGLLAAGTVIGAVFLQKYSAYHAIEFILLAMWFGSLKSVRVIITFSINLVLAIVFIGAMYATDISGFWISLVVVLLAAAVLLAGYIGYLTERARRLLFLETETNKSMTNRQELPERYSRFQGIDRAVEEAPGAGHRVRFLYPDFPGRAGSQAGCRQG
jgi:hypothetical protein